jgi:hypothetical protein
VKTGVDLDTRLQGKVGGVLVFAHAERRVEALEVRDPRHPEYGTITMIMLRKASAPGGLELDSWVALDSQNKRTTVRLSNQRYGVAVPANTFRWNDPRTANRK